jgi:hypothetical protein
MDKNEDSKTPSMIPGMGEGPPGPAAGPEAASEPTAESKIELASIDSPSLAPATADMTADMAADVAGPDARAGQPGKRPHPRPEAAEPFEEIKPDRPKGPGPVAQEITLVAAPASGRAYRGKFILLAAALVLAAALGAMAGVLGATGVARLAGEPATVPEPTGLQTSVAQLRSEIAALKASVDASGRNAGTQYSKLVERFDRVERMQSVATKSDAALPKDVTGSITPPAAGTAAPLPAAPTPPATTVPGWAVRDVYRGVAMLQSRMGGMVEVEPGDVLPGLGRIESIRRQDGHWVVMTSKGTITSLR